MSQTLYRKYRPKNFSEIIGQTHIVQTLANAVKNNRLGHAYLFTGPRGTGKTSIARILAKTANCENPKGAVSCEKCQSCRIINDGRSLDIIEIDAASNTGVDNIRELRETVALPPTGLKYKIYIIDEVHMLSTGAFNALLKTLEEPPASVIFILATTEIHKVPETIISRCQRFDFSRLPVQNIIEKLFSIAKAEKIKVEKEALEMIAISAEGGMRDAESLFAQIISLEDKNITAREVEEILGTTDRSFARDFCDFLIEKNSAAAIAKINELLEQGYDLAVFGKTFINYLRQLMLLKISESLQNSFSYELTGEQLAEMTEQSKKIELAEIIYFINLFLDANSKIGASILPQLPLEIAIIKATRKLPLPIASNKPASPARLAEAIAKRTDEQSVSHSSGTSTTAKNTPPQSALPEETNSELQITNYKLPSREESANTTSNIDISIIKQNWNKLLIDIQPHNHSLKALLSNCQPMRTSKNNIILATSYEFYKEKLDDQKNRLTIEQVFSKILGCAISISVEIDKSLAPKNEDASSVSETHGEPASPAGKQNSLLNSALEIMGGKVVNE